MRKSIMFFVVIAAVALLSLSMSEAAVFDAFAPVVNNDQMVIFTAGEFDALSHVVVNFNNTDGTGMAVILDPDGFPDSFPFGFAYLFFDAVTGDLFGSNDGVNWLLL